MSKQTRLLSLALLLLAAGAEGVTGRPPTPKPALAKPPAPLSDSAKRGLTFAQQRCSGCHGVEANSSSPNPESPPFEDIANRPNVTEATLQQFLRDSHNYPEAMNFEVEDARIGDLAAYIVTLKKPGYKPLVN